MIMVLYAMHRQCLLRPEMVNKAYGVSDMEPDCPQTQNNSISCDNVECDQSLDLSVFDTFVCMYAKQPSGLQLLNAGILGVCCCIPWLKAYIVE